MMMLVLGPVILVVVHRVAPSVFGVVALCIGLMATGYVATVLEGIVFPDLLNVVEHTSYALAGMAFVWLIVVTGKRLAEPRVGA